MHFGIPVDKSEFTGRVQTVMKELLTNNLLPDL